MLNRADTYAAKAMGFRLKAEEMAARIKDYVGRDA